MERKEGIARLTTENLLATDNQHYIVTYFIVNDIKAAVQQFIRGNLLDIGCGNKPYRKIIDPFVSKYVGCDVIQSSEFSVDVICPANNLSFERESFDSLFSTQVIEHVFDHGGMIRESYRVLKPGGYAIFTAPFCWELHEEPYDFFRFSKHGLRQLFEQSGFEVVLIKANGGKWAAISQLFLNALYSTRRYKTFRSKLVKLLFEKLKFLIVYNKFSVWLDQRYFDDHMTLNYLVVVKKRN